jgi:NADH-quinone oxidoreductase subunit J
MSIQLLLLVVAAPGSSNTKDLGILLYSEYVYPLQIAAAILLVAMIAAIALTLRARKDSKFISPSDQVRVKSRDRLKVVKLAATKPAVPTSPVSTTQVEK